MGKMKSLIAATIFGLFSIDNSSGFHKILRSKSIRGLSARLTMSSLDVRVQDLTKDGGVTKELIIRGQGRSIEPGDIVAVSYSASVLGSPKPFAKGDKEQFVVKDGSMIKGIDVAISSMLVGEKAKFLIGPKYAYGSNGVGNIIPPDANIEIEMKLLAWLGNQLRPESLFQKDLDIDPFIASTPESIQREYDDMQLKKADKYKGNIVEIYLRRLKSTSFGFGGVGFFTSQSGEKAPWYLNPNITFPAMISIVLAAFITVFSSGGVKEKGASKMDLEVASSEQVNVERASLESALT